MRKTLSGVAAVALMLSLAACGSDETIGVKANMGATIGISMPTKKSERWIGDGNSMKDQFTRMGYQVDLKYVENDSEAQVAQVDKMIDAGEKLLVISAVDGAAFTDVLAKAAQKGVKVIAYDRLLTGTKNVNAQATFDNFKVGQMQAQLLIDELGLSTGAKGPFNVELFAGSDTDTNAHSFFDAAMPLLQKYIDEGKIVVRSGDTAFKQVTILNYDEKASELRMRKLLRTYYKTEKVDAVLSPYDGMSRGIITGLQAYGYGKSKSNPMPVISGQDAELKSVQLMIANKQTGTIYKDTRELAKVAVQMGNALLTGARPIVNDTTTYNNGVKKVPTYLLYPVNVNKLNYETLLVKGGYYTQKQIDTPAKDA